MAWSEAIPINGPRAITADIVFDGLSASGKRCAERFASKLAPTGLHRRTVCRSELAREQSRTNASRRNA